MAGSDWSPDDPVAQARETVRPCPSGDASHRDRGLDQFPHAGWSGHRCQIGACETPRPSSRNLPANRAGLHFLVAGGRSFSDGVDLDPDRAPAITMLVGIVAGKDPCERPTHGVAGTVGL